MSYLRTQEIEIKQNISLYDLKLDKNREMDIMASVNSECEPFQYIKIANVNGKIAILTDDIENVVLEKWEGAQPYKKLVRNIEDEMEEGD